MTTLHVNTVAPHHVTAESLAQTNTWTVPEMSVFVRYEYNLTAHIQTICQPLTKERLIADWLDEVRQRVFTKRHTYQVFACYRVRGGKRIYDGLLIRDADELEARNGMIVKVMEVTL